MKKILPMSLMLLTLIAVHQTHAETEHANLPSWVNELRLKINHSFQIQVKTSSVKEPDRLQENEYFSFCLKGNSVLKKVPDPFEKMEKLFLAEGWKINDRYQADGHGGSSFAYGKGEYFCLISVWIDSGCDDDEKGHIPGEFWFEIYCREKDRNQHALPAR